MPAFPAYKTKPYYDALSDFIAVSIDLATGELKDSAVDAKLQAALANDANVTAAAVDAAAAAVDDAAAAYDYSPYVGPEVDAHIAADPNFSGAAETAVTNEIAGRDILEATSPQVPQAHQFPLVSDMAYARVFADGKRTFMEMDTDGKPTAWSADLISASLGGKVSTPYLSTADEGIAYARVFADGKRTFMEMDTDGKPTDWSASLISESLGVVSGPRAALAERVAAPRILNINNLSLSGSLSATTWTTYDGSGVIVHPSVRFFPDGFHGYQWWAAATPYPDSNDDYENPSIFVSANGTNWAPPPGVTNPLAPDPDPNGQIYNSDPYLTTGPDNRLYMFYRYANVNTFTETIRMMSSADGVTWTAPVSIHTNTGTTARSRLSPSVWYDAHADEWVMVASNFNADTGAVSASAQVLVRLTAPEPAGPWTLGDPVTVSPLPWTTGRNIWHLEVVPVGTQVVGIANVATGARGGTSYLLLSNDAGRTFTRSTAEIIPGATAHYKSSLVPVMTEYGLGLDIWIGFYDVATWGASRGVMARIS